MAAYERDLLAALDELCTRHPVVTGIEVDPVAERTGKIGLGERRLAVGPLAPVGLALLAWARRDSGILRLDAVGRYGPYWWVRLSTSAQPVTLLSRALWLSSNGGGTPVAHEPDRPEVTAALVGGDLWMSPDQDRTGSAQQVEGYVDGVAGWAGVWAGRMG